jgi:phosphoribosylformylglycinamidine cyclo-ligase
LFLLDYVAVAQLKPAELEQLVIGVAEGCRQAGVALLGGETAEHADTMAKGDFDLAGFAVGVVDKHQRLDGSLVRPTDVLIGLPSPGLRSNGYTLARHVLLERAQLPLDGPAWEGSSTTLADELLRPSVIYAKPVVSALRAHVGAIHAIAHITGGGIAGNLVRVLPDDVDADVDLGAIDRPRIFREIAERGPVSEEEMARVFNLGLGMVLVVDEHAASDVVATLHASGQDAVPVGRLRPGTKVVEVR